VGSNTGEGTAWYLSASTAQLAIISRIACGSPNLNKTPGTLNFPDFLKEAGLITEFIRCSEAGESFLRSDVSIDTIDFLVLLIIVLKCTIFFLQLTR
jgi:hypothetical protein